MTVKRLNVPIWFHPGSNEDYTELEYVVVPPVFGRPGWCLENDYTWIEFEDTDSTISAFSFADKEDMKDCVRYFKDELELFNFSPLTKQEADFLVALQHIEKSAPLSQALDQKKIKNTLDLYWAHELEQSLKKYDLKVKNKDHRIGVKRLNAGLQKAFIKEQLLAQYFKERYILSWRKPIIGREGWYYNRKTNLCWAEVKDNQGKLWVIKYRDEICGITDFLKDLHRLNHKPYSKELQNAIKQVIEHSDFADIKRELQDRLKTDQFYVTIAREVKSLVYKARKELL